MTKLPSIANTLNVKKHKTPTYNRSGTIKFSGSEILISKKKKSVKINKCQNNN